MTETVELWRTIRKERSEARARRLREADSTGWTKHTPYHWSRDLAGQRLHYWPSTGKFQYGDEVMKGDVQAFIREREA